MLTFLLGVLIFIAGSKGQNQTCEKEGFINKFIVYSGNPATIVVYQVQLFLPSERTLGNSSVLQYSENRTGDVQVIQRFNESDFTCSDWHNNGTFCWVGFLADGAKKSPPLVSNELKFYAGPLITNECQTVNDIHSKFSDAGILNPNSYIAWGAIGTGCYLSDFNFTIINDTSMDILGPNEGQTILCLDDVTTTSSPTVIPPTQGDIRLWKVLVGTTVPLGVILLAVYAFMFCPRSHRGKTMRTNEKRKLIKK